MNVVICGAGVVGAAIAYFLSLRGIGAVVVERCDVACAASGKSGGFLALDWCDGTPLEALAQESFALHAGLAESLDTDYGYRRVETFQLAASLRGNLKRYRRMPPPDWLDGNCAIYSALGSQGGTKVSYVRIGDDMLPTDAVVIAMGPWSVLASAWLPIPLVGGLKSHSILIRTAASIPAQALFVEFVSDNGDPRAPEVVPRADGEVYVCGIPDQQPLPLDPSKVTVRNSACNELHALAGVLSTVLGQGEVVRRQACYRPICADALPIMGKVPGVSGAYVATGHNCWGMLNAPASGLAMAELITEGKAKVVDLKPFAPERLPRARSDAAHMGHTSP
jgi:glycine/D-amino acid oxidase-like deaminating enzyme